MRCRMLYLGWLVTLALIGSKVVRTVRAQDDPRKLPRATVHVQVFGAFGTSIPESQTHVHLFTPDRKLDFAAQGQGATIADIPYGTYVLSVWDTGGGQAERELAVNTKDLWVRIGLALPVGDRLWPGGSLTISGTISPAPSTGSRDWWVRVEGVFLHVSREGPVPASGRFSIGGLEMGTYLVEVFEASKLRHIETVEIDPKRRDTHLNISVSTVKPSGKQDD